MSARPGGDRLKRLAAKGVTKLSLSQYYAAGRRLLKHRNGAGGAAGFSAVRLTAAFLHRELSVRIGQTAAGLERGPSPYRLDKIPQFAALAANYARDLSLLVDGTPEPATPEANEAFVATLRTLKDEYRANMWVLSQGLRALSSAIDSRDPRVVPAFLLAPAQRHLPPGLARAGGAGRTACLAPSGNMEMADPGRWPGAAAEAAARVAAAAAAAAATEPGLLQQQQQPQCWTPNPVCPVPCHSAACRARRLWGGDSAQQCAETQTRRFLDWLYQMNLGTQLLIEDHVAIYDRGQNLVQIIQPLAIASRAAHDARAVCERHYGAPAPAVDVVAPKPDVTTTYVPHHLYSMLFQLLKNALRATVERHRGQRGAPPPITLVMSSGDEDVTFRVSDQGGGIPLSQVDAIWSYRRTTREPDASEGPAAAPGSEAFMRRAGDAPLFGAGDGLPMARQIARYFGGDLDLVSMEGVGTDAYLHLSRSRNAAEPALDLSTLLDAASAAAAPQPA
ncbi:[Pyruvate dehydrogenase (acetyl-transferring)] kinase isozyme 2 [Coemansia javaensis]|uniref:Protein-serine/threonine kinase n=1 Tax=Coemansia javaensis TaxID=2761396 RepID=A0A9W8HKF7_9FUNG|nr:[Pyruvate dehydrogenase (acetyl-transferring)] kinase isozyme 2 [Coemansia javaensis]